MKYILTICILLWVTYSTQAISDSCGSKMYFRMFNDSVLSDNVFIGVAEATVVGVGEKPASDATYEVGGYSTTGYGIFYPNSINTTSNPMATKELCENSPHKACFTTYPNAAACTYDATYESYSCCCNSGYKPDTNSSDCNSTTSTSINSACYAEPSGSVNYEISCIDIDECDTKTDNCSISPQQDGTCNNTLGAYTCDCISAGYYWDTSTLTCQEQNLCLEINAHCSGVGNCSFDAVANATNCTCKSGYTSTGATPFDDCEDVNECLISNTTCDSTALCNNTVGSYECYCNETEYKYPRITVSAASTLVCDFDNCQNDSNHCGIMATCTNDLSNSVKENCSCSEIGYPYGDPDIQCFNDPCSNDTSCDAAAHQICVAENTTGPGKPYSSCTCESSYTAISSGSNLTCVAPVCNYAKFGIVLPANINNEISIRNDIETCLTFNLMMLASAIEFNYSMSFEKVKQRNVSYFQINSICVTGYPGDITELRGDISNMEKSDSAECYFNDKILMGFDKCVTGTAEYTCGNCNFTNGQTACCDGVGVPMMFALEPANSPIECGSTCDLTNSTCSTSINESIATIEAELNNNTICPTSNATVTIAGCTSNGLVVSINGVQEDAQDALCSINTIVPDAVDYNECHDVVDVVPETKKCDQSCDNTIGSFDCGCYQGIQEISAGVCPQAFNVTCTLDTITLYLHKALFTYGTGDVQTYLLNDDSACTFSLNNNTDVYEMVVTPPACGTGTLQYANGIHSYPQSSVSNYNSSIFNTQSKNFTFTCIIPSNVEQDLTINPGSLLGSGAPEVVDFGDQAINEIATLTITDETHLNQRPSDYHYTQNELIYFKAELIRRDPTTRLSIETISAASDAAHTQNVRMILQSCTIQQGFSPLKLGGNGVNGLIKGSFPATLELNTPNVYLRFTLRTCPSDCECSSYTTLTGTRKRRSTSWNKRIKRDADEFNMVVAIKLAEVTATITTQSTLLMSLLGVIAAVALIAIIIAIVVIIRRKSKNSE